MNAAINGKNRTPQDLSAYPRLTLSWLLFKLEPELLLFPLLSHRKHTRSSTPLSPLPPPLFLAAAVSSLPPVKDKSRRPSFFLFWFARGSPSLSRRMLLTPSPPGASSRIAGAPPDPLPSSIFFTDTVYSHSSSPNFFARGKHFPPPNSFSLSAHRRMRDLAGAAAPPPSGAGRRRGTSDP
jgi:hypothetical protein